MRPYSIKHLKAKGDIVTPESINQGMIDDFAEKVGTSKGTASSQYLRAALETGWVTLSIDGKKQEAADVKGLTGDNIQVIPLLGGEISKMYLSKVIADPNLLTLL